jgi:glycosyltransferase involved in cell wall biosynthesis
MILGVPSIASYVGGTMDMLEHGKEGFLYQANAPYMLAYYVMKIFANDQLAQQLSGNAVKRAKNTHSRESNGNSLMNIYRSIIK